VTHRASRAATRRRKWAPAAVFSMMATCSDGHRRQRKGPRAPEEIEGGETHLQRGREGQIGEAHHEGRVGGCSSRNPVIPAVGNSERWTQRRGQVAKVVRGLRREEPSAEDGGRKVTTLSGFFAPGHREKNGEEGARARCTAKREGRGLVWRARARGV
jgi:hypothetical protein